MRHASCRLLALDLQGLDLGENFRFAQPDRLGVGRGNHGGFLGWYWSSFPTVDRARGLLRTDGDALRIDAMVGSCLPGPARSFFSSLSS
jgi:hypothetical protein